MDGKVKIVFTDTPQGVRAHCPQCKNLSLEPTTVLDTPFVRCEACGFEAPTSIFTIMHEKAHGDRPMPKYALERLNGTAQAHNGTSLQPKNNLLKIMTATDWLHEAAQTPPQQPMFDGFFYERELSLFFGSANTGKSVLVMQIADALSKGARLQGTGVTFEMPKTPRKVLVCDFELNFKQFESRYSDNGANPYQFNMNLLRAEFDATAELPNGIAFEQVVLRSIEDSIQKHNVEVIFVDNLSALCANATEMRDAVSLMRELKRVKEQYRVTLCVVAHTPKIPPSQPIAKTHVSGSMALMNLCDSAFAVGESTQGSEIRYLKMIKSRASEFRYDADNVVVCRIGKHAPNFLGFDFIGCDSERVHLRQMSDIELDALEMDIIALHENEPNLSFRAIAERLGTNHTKVRRVIERVNKNQPIQSREPF